MTTNKILLLAIGLLVLGCGGSGRNSDTNQVNLRFSVTWPEPSRFIHQRSNKITVMPSVGGQNLLPIDSPWSIDRQSHEATTTITPLLSNLPTGPVIFDVRAFESANPTIILSRAQVTKTLLPGTTNNIEFVLESQVTSIEIQRTPNKPSYAVGEQFQLSAIGKNQAGAILLNSELDFELKSSNPSILLISPGGIATAITAGTSLITASQAGNDPTGALNSSISISVGSGTVGTYQLVDIGTLGSAFQLATGINDSGNIVGYCAGGAFRWVPGSGMTNIYPGGNSTTAQAINNVGQVVGRDEGGASGPRAFIWSATTGIQLLGTLGGQFSGAFGVNAAGEIVGDSSTAIGESHAFRWSSGYGMQDLGSLRGSTGMSAARGVNDNGTIVGYSIAPLPSINICAFVWTPGSGMSQLNLPAGESKAWAINNSGEIVGEFTNGGQTRAFCLSPIHGLTDIGAIIAAPNASVAVAINDNGEVVGGGGTGPFIWTRGAGPKLISSLVDASGTGWTVLGVNAINNNGWIAGTGLNPSGQVRGFVLVPN